MPRRTRTGSGTPGPTPTGLCDSLYCLRFNVQVILSGDLLDHVVAWCWGATAAFRPARPGFGRFWRPGRRGGQAGEIPADAAGGEPPGLAAAFPGQAVVPGQGPGQPQLSDRGDDDPGPAGELLREAHGGPGPAQGGLREPPGVLHIEAVKVAAGAQVQVRLA